MRPHLAIYEMSLRSASSGSGLVDARGLMEYKFADGCDGWAVESRSILRLQYDEGPELESSWSFASWEAKDGLSYRFRMQTVRNGQKVEDLSGQAAMGAPGQSGSAVFERPDGRQLALAAGTLFPTQHVAELIERAKSGDKQVGRMVFDGASLDNPYLVSAFIAPPRDDTAKELEARFKLPPSPLWPMRLAFFPATSRQAGPEFEMSVDYRADGIGGSIVQVFDEFSLILQPNRIELLPKPDC
ncbi:MAG: DUF1849 family protein [Hyphomicrobiales bacterium]|nr:DUF1849 family protein [Hyphomicrobiales bacterium]MCP5374126.1 DUF1849 family protein [Hyphomicrobiales bacterium]